MSEQKHIRAGVPKIISEQTHIIPEQKHCVLAATESFWLKGHLSGASHFFAIGFVPASDVAEVPQDGGVKERVESYGEGLSVPRCRAGHHV